jgi:ribosomal protein S13
MLKSPFEGKEDLIGSKLITQNLKAKLDEFMNESNDSDFDRKVFGIFGSWGIGKSTILDEMAYLYDLGNQEEDNTKYKIIRIDLWKYELLNSDLEAMTNDILKQISRKFITKKRLKKVINYIARMINGTKLTHGFNIPPLEKKSILDKTSHTGKTLFEINNVDDGKKIGKYDKVLIVFDELDRCSRINMERYLNYIKNISAEFSKKIYSAVVLDKNYLAEALFNKDTKHCNKFLEKIIKHEFDIEQKMKSKFKAVGENLFTEDEFADLVKCCDNNIRRILRILGEIEMSSKLIEEKSGEEKIVVAKLITLLNEIGVEHVNSSKRQLEQALKLINSEKNDIIALDNTLRFFTKVGIYENSQVENVNIVKALFTSSVTEVRDIVNFDNRPILAGIGNFISSKSLDNFAVEFKLNNKDYELGLFPILAYILGDIKIKVSHNIELNQDVQLNWSDYFKSKVITDVHYYGQIQQPISYEFNTTKIASDLISNEQIGFNVNSKILIEIDYKEEYVNNHFMHLIAKIVINFFSSKSLDFIENSKRIINTFLKVIDFL